MAEYDPAWLDNLFLAGEVVWGRLNLPRRDEDERPSMATPLARRADLAVAARRIAQPVIARARDSQRRAPLRRAAVLECSHGAGALFFGELKTATQMLPAHLEEALRELAAAGLVTSDAFAAVRRIVEGDRPHGSRRRIEDQSPFRRVPPIGRWSLFPARLRLPRASSISTPGAGSCCAAGACCFRDLLVRETSAPSWQELIGPLRRLELRGDVRGGRFVAQVAGEQYATARGGRSSCAKRDKKLPRPIRSPGSSSRRPIP